jgi:hypothetical protein
LEREQASVTNEQESFVLRYRIATMRLSRVAVLSAAELAALRILASRSGRALIGGANDELEQDRTRVESVLARLLSVAQASETVADATRELASPAE